MIQTVPLKYCEYNKVRKTMSLASEFFGMPSEFFVESPTGKKVKFARLSEDDVLFDQDQWDGEQQIYRPVGDVPNVKYLTIYNQY